MKEKTAFMLRKQDIKIVTNVMCSNLYITKKERAAWFRLKKILEEPHQQHPLDNNNPKIMSENNKITIK